MAQLAPFGFQAGQSRRSVNEYYVAASDTSTLAVGDPVKTNGNVFVGRLPDSRVSKGMLHVTKAASGQAIRGVIVGIVAGPGDNSLQSLPAAKTRPYCVLVNDNPQVLWDVQADNAAPLSAMAGMYASYAVGAPLGSVSSTVVDADSISATVSDLLIAEVLRNDGANSLLRVAFVQHEMAAAGGSPQIGAATQALVSGALNLRTNVITEQFHGRHRSTGGKLLVNGATHFSQRLKVPISRIQVGLPSGVSLTDPIEAAIQMGIGGYQSGAHFGIANLAGTAAPISALTWGSSDPNSFSNPGGGAANFTLTTPTGGDVSDTTDTLLEGVAWSDWLTVPDECFSVAPWVGIRFRGTVGNGLNSTPEHLANDSYARYLKLADPTVRMGYWNSSASTMMTSGSFATGILMETNYGVLPRIRYVTAGARAVNILCGGDSLHQGYVGGTALPDDNTPTGRLGGWPRIIVDTLNAEGTPAALSALTLVGRHSRVFHNNLLQEIERGRQWYTHCIVQVWTINDTLAPTNATPWAVYDAIQRTGEILAACQRYGIRPIVSRAPWSGTAGTLMPIIDNYIDQLEASGVAVVRLWQDWADSQTSTSIKAEFDIGDGVHPNKAGHEAVAARVMASRTSYGL